ncbi:hypothetical protein LG290_04650 [Halomonas sediminis]
MQQRIALVSCVKSKQSVPSRARDLYTSALFRGLRGYAEHQADEWFILSAQYGLVHPDQKIAPYEKTLNKMRKNERAAWAEKVMHELTEILPEKAEVIFLAGVRYREGLVPLLRDMGHTVSVPLEGLSFGRQLQQLKELEARGYGDR